MCSKDASFPIPSDTVTDVCVYGVRRERERERGGGRERDREKERECVYVRVCVDGFIVECPPPLLYTLRLGLMIRLGALQICIYIT